jgi:MFS family permease
VARRDGAPDGAGTGRLSRPRIDNPLLVDRDGRRLLAGEFLAQLGSGIGVVGYSWLILDAGGGPALASLVVPSTIFSYVLFGLVAGAVGDRYPRKNVMLVAYGLSIVAAAVIPLWSLAGRPSAPVVLAVAFLLGIGRCFVDAAAFGAIGAIAGRHQYVRAQSLLQGVWSSGQVAGPLIGGVAIAAVGATNAIAVQCVALALGATCIFRLRRSLAAPSGRPMGSVLTSIREGLSVIRDTPILRVLTRVQFAWSFTVVGSQQALLVAYCRTTLHLDAHSIGGLFAVGGVASVVGALSVGALAARFGGIRVIACCLGVSALAALGIAAAHDLVTAFPAVILMNLATGVGVTTLIGERQAHADYHLQARVGSTGRSIASLAFMLGGLLVSGLATGVALRTLYAGIGTAGLVLAAAAAPVLNRGAHLERGRPRRGTPLLAAVAVADGQPSSSATSCSRKRNFWTFVADIGHSVTKRT